MSDTVTIALLAAGCFVLWLILHRRKLTARRATAAAMPAAAPGWFAPCEPAEPITRTHSLLTRAAFSPKWHQEHGWPARATEHFPAVGEIDRESICLTVHVLATYKGNGLPNFEITETVKNPPELVLVSLQPDGPWRIESMFEIGAGILERARKDLPNGYASLPDAMSVDICMELTGSMPRNER